MGDSGEDSDTSSLLAKKSPIPSIEILRKESKLDDSSEDLCLFAQASQVPAHIVAVSCSSTSVNLELLRYNFTDGSIRLNGGTASEKCMWATDNGDRVDNGFSLHDCIPNIRGGWDAHLGHAQQTFMADQSIIPGIGESMPGRIYLSPKNVGCLTLK